MYLFLLSYQHEYHEEQSNAGKSKWKYTIHGCYGLSSWLFKWQMLGNSCLCLVPLVLPTSLSSLEKNQENPLLVMRFGRNYAPVELLITS